MKHTDNGIKHHQATTGCESAFTKTIVDKGDLGTFEMWHCNGYPTKGRGRGEPCTYAGRGKRLQDS